MGHAHPEVVEAPETVAKGTSFGAPTLLETKMAKLVCERVPSIEVVRMVNRYGSNYECYPSSARLYRTQRKSLNSRAPIMATPTVF